ncbi:MAG: protein of unknown function (DUF928) [Phormidesmis priestleyi Ana]|uniref:DUF928 domain-containing protein n=1 Tax=Phormidesmis priestleyi Ana TaxID=1666911 RepID=A0A0N8KM74_9CYAN|nr:MAG: protein of unknown function (DUF928) [Phormidesmis priestleyi Ana]
MIVLTPVQTFAQTVIEENANPSNNYPLITDEWSFWPTDQDRAPRRTASGSSRNITCLSSSIVPLIPPSQFGRTSTARPEILVYLPTRISGQAVFSIQSEENYSYIALIDIPEEEGIISIPLPTDAPDLANNQLYQWSLIVSCGDVVGPDSPSVAGWLETQTDIEESDAPAMPSLTQVTQYRDDYFWYDMLSMLARLKAAHPADEEIHQAWIRALEGNSLSEVVEKPLINAH